MLLKFSSLAWVSLMFVTFIFAAHPLPDGHIYRDIQVVVDNEKISLDVRLSASDVTWIDLIAKLDSEFEKAADGAAFENAEENNGDELQSESNPTAETNPNADLRKSTASPIQQIQATVQRKDYLPLPTTEDEVSAWLTQDKNRRIIEWWIAQHVSADFGDQQLRLKPIAKSRQNGRHHWAISVEVEFAAPETSTTNELNLTVDAFKEFPGLVRRAIKARGDVLLETSQLPPAIVRADFENIDEESTAEQRTERINAKLRF